MESMLGIDGSSIQLDFIQRSGIRNTYLRFRDDRLVVVARNRKSMQTAVERHKRWITKHYAQIRDTVHLFDSNSIIYNSKRYAVNYERSDSRPRADISDTTITVYAKNPESANRYISRMIMKKTLSLASGMTCRKAKSIGQSLGKVRVRRCRKWGACRSDRSITVNLCISMLPEELRDYVISHEVAHLAEMNHSRSFWSVVGQLCPDYRELKKRLESYDSRWRDVVQQ